MIDLLKWIHEQSLLSRSDLQAELEAVDPDNEDEILAFLDSHEVIIEYDDFAVVKNDDDGYVFVGDEGDLMIVDSIAELRYNVRNDVRVDGDVLGTLFDNTCCGETDPDDDGNISYIWFSSTKMRDDNDL